ncbi:hypothetical protein [Paenibacillus luteus]|uniref:hypothetical protein n=1 Tax=Paenibacillus luteus TaxID=2545753 RepID=UPI001142EFBF|nr:hypothetical protein [Paenibacillus luteus]
MLKNRLFFIGLGAGIIVGALLFQLMLSGEQSRERLGLMGQGVDEKLYTQAEVEALIQEERDSTQTKEEPQPTSSPDAIKDEPVAENNASTDAPAIAPTENVTEAPVEPPAAELEAIEHVIRIEPGSSLSKTAELLAANFIIADEAGFINQMKKSKKQVRAGYFLFHENSTVKEAITVVTGQPLTKAEADLINSNRKTN